MLARRQSGLSGEGGVFREQVWGGGGTIEVAGEATIEAFAGRRELLAETIHLAIRQWRKSSGDSGVVLEHSYSGHTHNGSGYGQAHGIVQQRIDVGFAGGAAE